MTGFAARSLLDVAHKRPGSAKRNLIRIVPDAAGILRVLMRLTKINA